MNERNSPAALSDAASDPIRGLFIDGVEQPAGSREIFPVVSPGTGNVIAHTVNANEQDVDAAVASARRAFEGDAWRKMSERTRAKFVYKLGDALDKHLDELYELETLNNGRPLRETRAQLGKVADLFRYNAGLALSKRDVVIPVEGNYLGYTLRRPVGVVANITPFNHPLLIAARNLAPTFASGCTTVVKPSEYTPLTTIRMWEIFNEAGLPPGVFNIVTGFGASTGKALTGHPGINKLVLTGGTESGRLAGAAAARSFAHQTLELGGKAPVVVFDDFDVRPGGELRRVRHLHRGRSDLYLLIQASGSADHLQGIRREAGGEGRGYPGWRSLRQDDPDGTGGFRTPTPARAGFRRDRTGRKRLAGGRRRRARASQGSGGFYVEPTVFADVTPDMRIAREEIFGPFTVILPFDTEEEALRIANDSPYGLAAAIRTNNVARAHRFAEDLEAGIIWINDHHRVDAASPWGGVKDSGTGREFGQEAFDHYFYTKAVMVNKSNEPFDWFEPEMRDLRLN
jgi:acyl-CoA reductase-like NAD-dependent aldehyde dehydrogenase